MFIDSRQHTNDEHPGHKILYDLNRLTKSVFVTVSMILGLLVLQKYELFLFVHYCFGLSLLLLS